MYYKLLYLAYTFKINQKTHQLQHCYGNIAVNVLKMTLKYGIFSHIYGNTGAFYGVYGNEN